MKKLLTMLFTTAVVVGVMFALGVTASARDYITDIGVAYGNEHDAAYDLIVNNGYTIVYHEDKTTPFDLNDGAKGDYVYMGYKTSTSHERAITGIVFRTGKDAPDSITYNGGTFYKVGGLYEPNGTGDGAVDLNSDAGGSYIYTYITRDKDYGPTILSLRGISHATNDTDYRQLTAKKTDGTHMNLNEGTDNPIYLCYSNYYAVKNTQIKYMYLYGDTVWSWLGQSRFFYEGQEIVPDFIYEGNDTTPPATVTYRDGRTYTHYGWTTDSVEIHVPNDTTPPLVKERSDSVTYYAVYERPVTITYDSNGGSGVSQESQTIKIFENVNSNILNGVPNYATFDINATATPPTDNCKIFLGWATKSTATEPAIQVGETFNTYDDVTFYAVWQTHNFVHHDTVFPTCTTPGTKEHYRCTECGKCSLNSDGTLGCSEEFLVIPAREHYIERLTPAKDPVHTPYRLEPGVAAHYKCGYCGEYFTEDKVETTLEALTGETPYHTYDKWVTTDAKKHWKECTCGRTSEEGAHTDDNSDYICDVCGKDYTTAFEITSYDSTSKTATLFIPIAGTYRLIFADYDGDALSATEIITVTVTEDKVGEAEVPSVKGITLGKDDKIMLLSDLTTIQPKCQAYTVE